MYIIKFHFLHFYSPAYHSSIMHTEMLFFGVKYGIKKKVKKERKKVVGIEIELRSNRKTITTIITTLDSM